MAESSSSSTNGNEKNKTEGASQPTGKESDDEDPHKITTVEAITSFGGESQSASAAVVDKEGTAGEKEDGQSEQKNEENLTPAEKKALRLQKAKMMAKKFEEKLRSSGLLSGSPNSDMSSSKEGDEDVKQLDEEGTGQDTYANRARCQCET